MKILTRKQAIEQGYTIDEGSASVGCKDIGSHIVEVEVMTEREEELVEALRGFVNLNNDDSGTYYALCDDARKLLEKYDA